MCLGVAVCRRRDRHDTRWCSPGLFPTRTFSHHEPWVGEIDQNRAFDIDDRRLLVLQDGYQDFLQHFSRKEVADTLRLVGAKAIGSHRLRRNRTRVLLCDLIGALAHLPWHECFAKPEVIVTSLLEEIADAVVECYRKQVTTDNLIHANLDVFDFVDSKGHALHLL